MIILPSLTIQFRDSSIGQPVSWAWDFGDGNTSTERNPQHTYIGLEQPAEYTVMLTSTDASGVQSTASKTIQVPAAQL
jgi:PKD repeat protein